MKTHFYKITNGPLDQVQMEVMIPDRILFPMALLKSKQTGTPVDKVMLTRDDVINFLAMCIKMFDEAQYKDAPPKQPDTIVMDKSKEDVNKT